MFAQLTFYSGFDCKSWALTRCYFLFFVKLNNPVTSEITLPYAMPWIEKTSIAIYIDKAISFITFPSA